MRQRRDADRAPVRIAGEHPGRLARKAAAGPLSEAEVIERGPDLLRLELQRELRHADIGGLGQHRGEVDGAEIVLVFKSGRADLDETGNVIDDAGGGDLTGW